MKLYNYINESNVEKYNATEEECKKYFEPLADQQRGKPESAMLKLTRFSGGGVINPVAEHGGDLVHRMTEMGYFTDFGLEYVIEKTKRIKRYLEQPYGFVKEFNENIENNAKYNNIDVNKFRSDLFRLLTLYAQEHNKLKVYNYAQLLANRIPIEVGRLEFKKATKFNNELLDMTKNTKKWIDEASTIYKDQNGKILFFNIKYKK